MSRLPWLLLAWSLLPLPLHAQGPLPSAVAYPIPIRPQWSPPSGMPAQLEPPPPLFVRLNGPPGMEFTVYRGQAKGHTLAVPAVIGLRPGYVYRFQATGGAAHPGLTIYPTLEVRGSLVGGKVRPQDHPAALNITPEDLASVARGSLVTRVLALEQPDTAVPIATRAELPLEFDATTSGDPLTIAQQRGTAMLILRLGQREYNESELVAHGQTGTVMLPGEKLLVTPRAAPYLPWFCRDLYDPILGPRPFPPHYCLPDGGDTGTKAGIGPDGKLAGLDPTDAIAQYVDSRGRKHIVASNRVCICVPRFFVVRHEMTTGRKVSLTAPRQADLVQGRSIFLSRYLLLTGQQQVRLEGMDSKTRLSGAVQLIGPAVYGQVEGLDVTVSLRGVKNVTTTTLGPEETEPSDGPLQLFKWPDRLTALIGEIVTFYLRYTNRGRRPIRNVLIADSLGPRFEYVPGSARSDRDGTFTTQNNETGSLILSWEMGDDLPPGESGVVSFQARVR